MTDLIERPTEATPARPDPVRPDPARPADAATTASAAGVAAEGAQWAPAEKKPKKKRYLGWWIGVPGAALLAGAGVCAATLIAPGAAVAGTEVGFRTPAAAANDIAAGLANTPITISGSAGDVTIPAHELGVSVDSQAAAQAAFSERPLWKVGEWNAGAVDVPVTIDQDKALAALTAAAPDLFREATPAEVRFDGGTGGFVATESAPGVGVDMDALASAVTASFDNISSGGITVAADPVEVAPTITTEKAQAEADSVNALLGNAAFFVGDEQVADIDPAQLASWTTVTAESGEFTIDVDESRLGEFVASLPAKVNREPVTADVITNSAGSHLQVISAGQNGYKLGDTSSVAKDFAAAIESGNAHYELPVEVVEHQVNGLLRRIEVNKGAGTATLFENDAVVASFPIASGRPGHESTSGHFTINAFVEIQDMGDCNGNDYGYNYCQEDVPWVMYYNGDEALHGTHWHQEFGNGARRSSGCINMTVEDARFTYNWAAYGTEVHVY